MEAGADAAGWNGAPRRPRGAPAADTTLVKALARAFRWRRMMEAGRYATINELAAAEKINSSHVSRLLRLTLPGLMEPFPVEWGRQHLET